MSQEAKKTEILSNILGPYQRQGSELLFFCPACHHHKKKLSVNITKDSYKCWICDIRGHLPFLVRRYGDNAAKATWQQVSGVSLSDEPIEEEKMLLLPAEYIPLCKKKVSILDLEPIAYLKSRGLTFDDICLWRIGYCRVGDYQGRIIVPSFDAGGNLNFFVTRAYGREWPPYKNPEASKDIIFNELMVDWPAGEVTLVEGVFDAMKVEKNVVPLLGSTLREDSRLFKKIVDSCHTVYMVLDPDAVRKENRVIQSLISYGIEVRKVHIPPERKDVGNLSKEEYQFYRQQAEVVELDNSMMFKMTSIINSGSCGR